MPPPAEPHELYVRVDSPARGVIYDIFARYCCGFRMMLTSVHLSCMLVSRSGCNLNSVDTRTTYRYLPSLWLALTDTHVYTRCIITATEPRLASDATVHRPLNEHEPSTPTSYPTARLLNTNGQRDFQRKSNSHCPASLPRTIETMTDTRHTAPRVYESTSSWSLASTMTSSLRRH